MPVGDVFLSAQEFADKLGTSKKNVNRLARDGVLTRLRDKSFPWPKAKYEWQKYLQQREKQQPMLSQKNASKDIIPKKDDLVDDESEDIINIDGDEISDDPIEQRKKDLNALSVGERIIDALKRNVKGAENSSYHYARALSESAKARKQLLEILEMESKTLKTEEVQNWLYQISRQNRDIWLNWPQRVATEMAEQLGVDARLMNDVLMKAVRFNLERIATLPENYGRNSVAGISEGSDTTS